MDPQSLFSSVLRLHYQPTSGTLLSSTQAILNLAHQEPVSGLIREEAKLVADSFSISCIGDWGSLVSYSPSRQRKVVFRSKDDQLTLELYVSDRLEKVLSLAKNHGPVLAAPVIGRPVWSGDELTLAYIAEAKVDKAASFWSADDGVARGKQFIYKETLGDGLESVSAPTLWIYSSEENAVQAVQLEAGQYPAQPAISLQSDELAFVGYRREAYLRGIASNVNRITTLYRYSLKDKTAHEVAIPDRFMAAVHPRYSPDGRHLAYYGVPHTTSYSTSVVLCLCAIPDGTHRVLLDLVRHRNRAFNGIYGYHSVLAKMCWSSARVIVLETHFEGGVAVFMTDLEGNVREIQLPVEKPSCAEVLDVGFDSVLIKVSNVTTYPQVYLAALSFPTFSLRLLDGHPLTPRSPSDSQILQTLSSVHCEALAHNEVTSFLYWTNRGLPLCVILHGGPHNTGYAYMSSEATLLLAMGFNVLMANYRGTTGFGLDNLDALTGHIGEMDLADVLTAIDLARSSIGCTKVFSLGISHGGFLSAHLACTGLVDGSVVKNGVCSIADMLYASDTPDWAPGTALGKDTPHPVDEVDLVKMYRASPVAKAGSVTCPVLIVVGEMDVCVPCFSSLNFYKILKQNDVDTTMLWYPKDRHVLSTPATQHDYILNEAIWLKNQLT